MRFLLKRIRTIICKLKYLNSCKVEFNSIIDGKCVFEGCNRVGRRTVFYSSQMGFGSYIGNNGCFTRSKIGKYCSIGNNVSVINLTHPIDGVSTYPGFYLPNHQDISFVKEIKAKVSLSTKNSWHCEIGNDVWIGNNVLICGGVTIGDGAVIGMGTVVTKDIPPYAVVVGVPARVIRYRFDKDVVTHLMNLKWWDKDIEWIRNNAGYFMDVDDFINKNCNSL